MEHHRHAAVTSLSGPSDGLRQPRGTQLARARGAHACVPGGRSIHDDDDADTTDSSHLQFHIEHAFFIMTPSLASPIIALWRSVPAEAARAQQANARQVHAQLTMSLLSFILLVRAPARARCRHVQSARLAATRFSTPQTLDMTGAHACCRAVCVRGGAGRVCRHYGCQRPCSESQHAVGKGVCRLRLHLERVRDRHAYLWP